MSKVSDFRTLKSVRLTKNWCWENTNQHEPIDYYSISLSLSQVDTTARHGKTCTKAPQNSTMDWDGKRHLINRIWADLVKIGDAILIGIRLNSKQKKISCPLFEHTRIFLMLPSTFSSRENVTRSREFARDNMGLRDGSEMMVSDVCVKGKISKFLPDCFLMARSIQVKRNDTITTTTKVITGTATLGTQIWAMAEDVTIDTVAPLWLSLSKLKNKFFVLLSFSNLRLKLTNYLFILGMTPAVIHFLSALKEIFRPFFCI